MPSHHIPDISNTESGQGREAESGIEDARVELWDRAGRKRRSDIEARFDTSGNN